MSDDGDRGQEYECERCGLRALVEMSGQVTPLVMCPACGKRARLAGAESLARVVAYGIGGGVVMGIGLGYGLLLFATSFAVGALVGAALEVRAWQAGRHARVIRQLRAPRELALPEAYVRKRPRDED